MPSVPIFCQFEVGCSQVQNCFKLGKELAPKAHVQVKFCSDPVRSEDYFPEWKSALTVFKYSKSDCKVLLFGNYPEFCKGICTQAFRNKFFVLLYYIFVTKKSEYFQGVKLYKYVCIMSSTCMWDSADQGIYRSIDRLQCMWESLRSFLTSSDI